MTTETPLARLTELDARLAQFLNACPTLWSVLSANLASGLSPPANTLAPDAIYLDEQPLTHWLAQAIATPGSGPQGPVLYATAQGLIPTTAVRCARCAASRKAVQRRRAYPMARQPACLVESG